MTHCATNQLAPCTKPEAQQPKVLCMDGWSVRDYLEVSSTNFLAAKLPAWSAVRAETQTAGRGRFQRNWVSDKGGLWLSAVVPTGKEKHWQLLPLAVGLAVCNALLAAGVSNARMRWPNDILIQNRKLAGLLIDQFTPGLAVAGIGVNVFNQPEQQDAKLTQKTARLADLTPHTPSFDTLTEAILKNLRHVISEMQTGGFAALHSQINTLWGPPRRVELDLDGVLRRGIFSSVDEHGRLVLLDASAGSISYDTHQVKHLTEL
jgi:BirA family transcriptional regulator, biotin operon repressor / biotin---[acetyl-CoA-carboxylase] ligase